jgi:hypothetical protein
LNGYNPKVFAELVDIIPDGHHFMRQLSVGRPLIFKAAAPQPNI